MEAVELKVEMVGIHEKRLRKCISKLKDDVWRDINEMEKDNAGIEKVEVDANSGKVVVSGYAHRNKILKAVRRGGLKADFWSPQNDFLNAYAATSTLTRFNNFSLF